MARRNTAILNESGGNLAAAAFGGGRIASLRLDFVAKSFIPAPADA
jgi:hypothetical protein